MQKAELQNPLYKHELNILDSLVQGIKLPKS